MLYEDAGDNSSQEPNRIPFARSFERDYAALCRRVRSRLTPSSGSALDPEDIVQDALLAAWSSVGRFELRDESHGDAPDAPDASDAPDALRAALSAWLQRITDSKTVDALRRSRFALGDGPASDDAQTELGAGPSVDPLVLSEAASRIYNDLEALSADQRTVVMLKDMFGLEWSSVSDIVGRKVNACQALRTRAFGVLARRNTPPS